MVKTIAIHDGKFHADEAFAVAVLKFLFDVKVVRTRDASVLAAADMRVDVGMKYDVKTSDYDHHQDAPELYRKNGIKYASFGLIWKEFGVSYCKKLVGRTDVDKLVEVVDRSLVQSIDASDNGQLEPVGKDELTMYPMKQYVRNLNPTWNEKDVDVDVLFMKAVKFGSDVLSRHVVSEAAVLDAKDKVRALVKKNKFDEYIVLDEYMPWQEVIVSETSLKYVVFLGTAGDQWIIVAVPTLVGTFDYRKRLPKKWGGLLIEELRRVTGVKDAMFCHLSGFIAGARSLEGAKKLVELALKE